MANIYERLKNERIKLVMNNTNEILREIGIVPGNNIWVIHNACHGCSKRDDHCAIDCDKKDKWYLEKVRISKVDLSFDKNMQFHINFTDTNDDRYSEEDIDITVFVNKEDAIEKL